MAPGDLLQSLIVPETKKIRTLLPGFGFFMAIEKGRTQPFGGVRPSSVPMARGILPARLPFYGVVAQIDAA